MKYINISCNKEHKKVLIPEETSKKIKKAITSAFLVLEASLFVIAPCSGCRATQNDINSVGNSGQTVSDTDDRKEDNNGLDITFADNEYKYEDVTYNQLVTNLNNELDKKDFSQEARDLFKDTLDRLYKNYPEWQRAYKDMPSREQYIQVNLIDAIKTINKIELYEEDSEEAQELDEQGFASGFTSSDFEITLVYKDPTYAEEFERQNDIERFLHEVIHCKQRNIAFNTELFNGDENLKNLFVEGSATFHMKFVNRLTSQQRGMWSISNEDETSTIDYSKDNCTGYLIELNAYENLVYLAGYDAIYSVEQGQDYSTIENAIASKYGEEKANNIIATMVEWYNEYSENWQSDKAYNLAIKLQNLYFDCIKEDIQNLDIKDKDQIKKYMEIYRNYKLKNLPQIIDSNGENCTNEIFNIDSIDNMLIDKIIESDAMGKFSSNEKLNRMAIKSLIFASNDAYFEKDGIYDTIYLPYSIEGMEYTYSENSKKDKGKLTLKYQNRGDINNSEVLLDIIFNENEIIQIAEADENINVFEEKEDYER